MTIVMAILQFFPIWANVIYVAVLMISIQMVLGNILDPRIQGYSSTSPLYYLSLPLSLGYIWGVAGMFLAVPITSVIQIVCANVQSLKPIAVMIGSGSAYRKVVEKQKRQTMKEKRQQRQAKEESSD